MTAADIIELIRERHVGSNTAPQRLLDDDLAHLDRGVLLREVDRLRRLAERLGHQRMRFFDPTDDLSREAREQLMTEAARIVRLAQERGEFLKLECGYVYYCPQKCGGAFSAWMLRALAFELDRRNFEWDQSIQRTLAELSAIEPGKTS